MFQSDPVQLWAQRRAQGRRQPRQKLVARMGRSGKPRLDAVPAVPRRRLYGLWSHRPPESGTRWSIVFTEKRRLWFAIVPKPVAGRIRLRERRSALMHSSDPETPRPVHGDVLIGKDAKRRNTYTLSVFPGPPQMRCRSYQEAASTASAWAARQSVAIWRTNDNRRFTRVLPEGGPLPAGNPPDLRQRRSR